MKKIISLLLLLCLVSFVSADSLGTFKAGDCVSLYQLCDSCSYVNISSITYPNSTILFLNEAMTKNNADYNYTFCDTELKGDYAYKVCGDKDGFVCENIAFEITATGKPYSSAKSWTYGVIVAISIMIFFGFLWIGFKLPSGNKRNSMTGYIFDISNLKYAKYVSFGMAYICLVVISYLIWMINYAYLDFEFLAGIFKFIFYFLVVCLFPLFILFSYITISNLINDYKIADLLSRGIDVI